LVVYALYYGFEVSICEDDGLVDVEIQSGLLP